MGFMMLIGSFHSYYTWSGTRLGSVVNHCSGPSPCPCYGSFPPGVMTSLHPPQIYVGSVLCGWFLLPTKHLGWRLGHIYYSLELKNTTFKQIVLGDELAHGHRYVTRMFRTVIDCGFMWINSYCCVAVDRPSTNTIRILPRNPSHNVFKSKSF